MISTGEDPSEEPTLFTSISDDQAKTWLEAIIEKQDSIEPDVFDLAESTLLVEINTNKAWATPGVIVDTVFGTEHLRYVPIESDSSGNPSATLEEVSEGEYEGNEINMKCTVADPFECSGQVILSTVLSTFDDSHDNDQCNYEKDGFSQKVTPCAEEMDTNVECVEMLGSFISIKPLKVDVDTGCLFQFDCDISDCHSNRDEFLRLMWFD